MKGEDIMKKVRRDYSRLKAFGNAAGLMLMALYMMHLIVGAMFG